MRAVSYTHLESGGTIAVPQKPDGDTPQEPADSTPENDVVSAYMASLGEYADVELPAGVTYEMPEINFERVTPAAGTVTSKFGYRMHPIENVLKFHYGTDIGAAEGTDIVSFADGTVIAAGESTSLGNYIIIAHADGVKTQYAHCSELFVSSGDSVTKGQKIAAVGATGEATGNNLHFELTVNDAVSYTHLDVYKRQAENLADDIVVQVVKEGR